MTSPPAGLRCFAVNISLSVCRLTQHENHTAKLHQLFVSVAYVPRLIVLWQCYDTICTSSFVDYVMLSYNGRWHIMVGISIVMLKNSLKDNNWMATKYCSVIKTSSIVSCPLGVKSAIYDCLVIQLKYEMLNYIISCCMLQVCEWCQTSGFIVTKTCCFNTPCRCQGLVHPINIVDFGTV